MTKISELLEKVKKIPLVNLDARVTGYAQERLYLHIERDEAYNRLAAVSNSRFATICLKEVEAKTHTYDVKMEIARMNCASSLLACGVPQENVIAALKNGDEFILHNWVCSQQSQFGCNSVANTLEGSCSE